MIIHQSTANGQMTAPPSKSMAHRYLICATLADGCSVIDNVDLSEDIKATLDCAKVLGAKIEYENRKVTINGIKTFNQNEKSFFCNESGSTLRFFIPIAMYFGAEATFSGSEVLLARPLSIYQQICQRQNIKFEHKNNQISVDGKLHSDKFEIQGNISSQFISGLLFVLPLLDGDSQIILTHSIESKPYIDMTLQVQAEFGIKSQWINENTLLIAGGQKYKATNAIVEGDYSNAAFFEAFNTVGANVKVEGLNENSLQGDKVYQKYFKMLNNGFTKIDISDCPDLGPILFVVAATHHGAEFVGTKRLAIKESNRGKVMCQELAKFGVKTLQEDNRIVIFKSQLNSPTVDILGHNDHRIVMALAVLLSVVGGKIIGVEAVKKSLPDFFSRIRQLGINFDFEGESNGLDN